MALKGIYSLNKFPKKTSVVSSLTVALDEFNSYTFVAMFNFFTYECVYFVIHTHTYIRVVYAYTVYIEGKDKSL